MTHIIQELNELLQLGITELVYADLSSCAVVKLAESNLELRQDLDKLVKGLEQARS